MTNEEIKMECLDIASRACSGMQVLEYANDYYNWVLGEIISVTALPSSVVSEPKGD